MAELSNTRATECNMMNKLSSIKQNHNQQFYAPASQMSIRHASPTLDAIKEGQSASATSLSKAEEAPAEPLAEEVVAIRQGVEANGGESLGAIAEENN